MGEHIILNHQRMLHLSKDPNELPTSSGSLCQRYCGAETITLHDFVCSQRRTEVEDRMGMLKDVHPSPNCQEAEVEPPSLFGPAKEMKHPR